MSVRKLAACRGNNGSINSCSANEIINILTAHWGRHRGQVGCGNAISSTCASSNSLSIVKSFCQGQNTCIIGATIANFGSACPSGQEYLWVDFECVAVTTTTATTAALTTESESTAAAVTTLQYTAEPTTDFTTTLQSAAEPTTVSVTALQSTLDPATDGPVTTSQSTAQPTSVHETTSQSAAESTASPVTNLQFIVEPTAIPVTNSQSIVEPTAIPVTNSQSIAEPTAIPVSNSQSIVEPTAIPVTNSQSIAEPTAIPVSNSQSVVDPTAIPATYSQAIVEQTALPVFNSQYVVEPTAISITSSQSTAPLATLPLPTLESNAESGTTKERYTTTESTEAAGAAAAMSSAALGGLLVGIFVVLIMIALVLIFRKNKVYAHEFHDDTSEHAVESSRDDSTVVENESLISETAREAAQVSITSKSGHDISAGDVNNSVKRSRQEVSQLQLSLVSEPQRVSHDGNDQQYVVARENEAQVSSSQESTCTRVSGPASQVQKSASGAAENRSESCKDAVESTGSVESGLQRTAADNHSESGKDMTDTALSSKSASSIKSGVPMEHAATEVESSHSQKSAADDYQAQGQSLHDPDSADSFATRRDSARSKTALEDCVGGRENCD